MEGADKSTELWRYPNFDNCLLNTASLFTSKLLTSSVTRLGDLLDFGQVLKPLAAINLLKSPTFLGNFCKGVKIYHFSCEIIFGQLL